MNRSLLLQYLFLVILQRWRLSLNVMPVIALTSSVVLRLIQYSFPIGSYCHSLVFCSLSCATSMPRVYLFTSLPYRSAARRSPERCSSLPFCASLLNSRKRSSSPTAIYDRRGYNGNQASKLARVIDNVGV